MKLGRIRERYRARPGYWFRPKLFGFGVAPVTWQGWLATLVLIAAGIAVAKLAKARTPEWLVLLVPLILAYAWLAWTKTDGVWGWRGGPGDD